MTHPCETATSWLFVPGNQPRRFDSAVSSGADMVVIDLEDAVAEADKGAARREATAFLSSPREAVAVRINARGTNWHGDDVTALAHRSGLSTIMVPKAEDTEHLGELADHFGPCVPIIALIESAAGLAAAREIAKVPGVARLAFGTIDYALDLGSDESNAALLSARSELVLASRLATLSAPVDGVTVALHDTEAVSRAALYAQTLGFGGKLCVHPQQVVPVNETWAVSDQQLAWATAILSATAVRPAGAFMLDGSMIDSPVQERARRILASQPPAP